MEFSTISRRSLFCRTYYSSTQHNDRAGFWIIFGAAAIFELAWFTVVNVGFFMDSVSYLNYALGITGQELDWGNVQVNHDQLLAAISRRTSGYPLLLVATGVATRNTLIGILALQAFFAISMPLLVFGTLQPISKKAAFVTSIVLIFTLEPFTYSKVISSDHTFKFLLLLLVYFASVGFRAPSKRVVLGIGISGFLLTMVRPQGSLICLLVFAMLLIAHSTRWKIILGSFGALSFALACVSFATSLFLIPDVPSEIRTIEVSQNVEDRIAALLLFNAYASNKGELREPTGEQHDALRQLRVVLEAYANESSHEWATLLPNHYFGKFAQTPDQFVTEIYDKPNPFYFTIMRRAVVTYARSSRAPEFAVESHLIWRVIREVYWNHPSLAVSFVSRFLMSSSYNTTGQQIWGQMYTSSLPGSLAERNGPATSEIIELVRLYFSDFPNYLPSSWRDDPGGVEKLIYQMSMQPAESYWYFMWEVVDRLRGRAEANSLFLRSATEFDQFGFKKAIRFIDNFSQFFLGVPVEHTGGRAAYDTDPTLFFLAFNIYYLPEPIRQEIEGQMRPFGLSKLLPTTEVKVEDYNNGRLTTFAKFFSVGWFALRNITVAAIICTFLFSIRRGTARLPALIMGIIIYQAAVISIITDMYIRYIDQILPLMLLLAGLTVTYWLRSLTAKTSQN